MEIEEIIKKAITEIGLTPDGVFTTAYELVARKAIELAQTEWKKQPQNSYADGYNKGYDDGFLKAEEAIRKGETFQTGYDMGYKNAAKFYREHPEMVLSEVYMEQKMIPFDLEKAKNGHAVCVRDGRDARILCYDKKDGQPIVALLNDKQVCCYYTDGIYNRNHTESYMDLVMKMRANEAWINMYDDDGGVYKHKSEAEALKNIDKGRKYITTVKVKWYE